MPDADKLTAEVKIAPLDIDPVRIGQTVLTRFPMLNQRVTPEINGTVDHISADVTTDQRTGQNHFTVRVVLSVGEGARLGAVKIVSGMPVECMIKTTDRKVIS